MGSRANFVVVEESGWRLHSSRWAAQRFLTWFMAGPDVAVAFVDGQFRCDHPDGWLDDVWAEGGALVDLTTRQMLWYTDGLVLSLADFRAAHALLEQMWPGWQVRWAYDGLGDLAAHVGVDRAVVRHRRERLGPLVDHAKLRLALTSPPGSLTDHDDYEGDPFDLLTVRQGNGYVACYVTDSDLPFDHLAWRGPDLLGQLPHDGDPTMHLRYPPDGGLHLDVAARTVGVWSYREVPGLLGELEDLWPGWRVEFWQDHVERQVAGCGGALTIQFEDPAEAIDELGAELRTRWEDNRFHHPSHKAIALNDGPHLARLESAIAAAKAAIT